MAVESLFEKIVPKEKIFVEEEERGKASKTRFEGKDIKQIKLTASYIYGRIEELGKKIENLESSISIDELERRVHQVEKNLQSLKEDSDLFATFTGKKQIFLKNIERFEDFLENFNSELNSIEETKKQMAFQTARVQSIYHEIEMKLEGLSVLIDKMKQFDEFFTLAERLKNLENDMKKEIENQFASWNLPVQTIEKIKLQILEQKFLSFLTLIPSIKEKSLQMSVFYELKSIIRELKRNDLWDANKKLLLDETLKHENIQSMNIV